MLSLFFFKETIIFLLVFILPLIDFLTLANSFSINTYLLANSSCLAIRVPNSSWIPLAIYVAISAPFFSIHILFQDLSPELLIIHPFLLAACSSSFSFYLPFQVVFQKLLLPFIVAEINSGFFLSSSSLLTIFFFGPSSII